MDSDNKASVLISVVAGVALCFIAATTSSCVKEKSQRELETINNAIKAGVDPMLAKCAIDVTDRSESVCIAATVKAGKRLEAKGE